jgi:hypothetical protein
MSNTPGNSNQHSPDPESLPASDFEDHSNPKADDIEETGIVAPTGKGIGFRILGWFLFVIEFAKYLFDMHNDEGRRQFDLGSPHRVAGDRERALHLAWHAVVYFPVLVVGIVAKMIGASIEDVTYFCCLAAATVSLEICIGIIVEKAKELRNLSRQTKSLVSGPNEINDLPELKGWVLYYQQRHAEGRVGIAKAALITAVSLVLFGAIVGIEAYKMQSHAIALTSHGETTVTVRKDVESDKKHAEEQKTSPDKMQPAVKPDGWLLTLAVTLSSLLVAIAMTKLWIQTRNCLAECDPVEIYESPSQAIEAFKRNPIYHLSDNKLLRQIGEEKEK